MTLEKDNPKYEVIMQGYHHRHIWDARKLVTGAIETRFDIETGTKQEYYVCPKCAAPVTSTCC